MAFKKGDIITSKFERDPEHDLDYEFVEYCDSYPDKNDCKVCIYPDGIIYWSADSTRLWYKSGRHVITEVYEI